MIAMTVWKSISCTIIRLTTNMSVIARSALTLKSTTRTMGESATIRVMNAIFHASTVSTGTNSSRTSRWVFNSLCRSLVTTVFQRRNLYLNSKRMTCSIFNRPVSPASIRSPWHRLSTCRCTINVSEIRCLTGTASPKPNFAVALRVWISNSLFHLSEWNLVATQQQLINN